MPRAGKEKVNEASGSGTKRPRSRREPTICGREQTPKRVDTEEERAKRESLAHWLARPYTLPLTFDIPFFRANPATRDQFAEVENRGWVGLLDQFAPIYPRLV